jgi:hypothetical protein
MAFAFGMGALLGALATNNMTSAWGVGGASLAAYGLYRLLRDMPAMWRYVFPKVPLDTKERIRPVRKRKVVALKVKEV